MSTEHSDQQHLRLLSIFHYVLAGITALYACTAFIYLAIGIGVLTGGFGTEADTQELDSIFGWMFVGVAAVALILGWALAVCMVLAGRYMSARRKYLFCMVVACVECLMTPLGTILGVFTIVVLQRESVKGLFGDGSNTSGAAVRDSHL